MSILQEFEDVKAIIGHDKFDAIENYLKNICPQDTVEKYFKELNTIWETSPDLWGEKIEKLKKKYGVVLLNDILYKKEESIKFNNWYNENIKQNKVEIINFWLRDFVDDIGVNAILYKNGVAVANIADSFEETDVRYNIAETHTELTDELTTLSLTDLLYNHFDNYLNLPKISNCSKLLQNIFDDIYASDSEMLHITYSDWDEFYQEDYSDKDIDILKNEINKYNLQTVLEVDNGEYKILGYGDLITFFNDDRNLNKEKLLYVKGCIDYKILTEYLNQKELEKIDEVLYSFCQYQSKYDDGEKDIIGEYISQYGNSNIIEWYEGLKSTNSFIEDFILYERGNEFEK